MIGRCNLIGDPHFAGNRSKQQIADWINPAAFEPSFGTDQNFWANYNPNDPRAWQWGNMGPVLPNMRSPGFWNVDTALTKNFHVSEANISSSVVKPSTPSTIRTWATPTSAIVATHS